MFGRQKKIKGAKERLKVLFFLFDCTENKRKESSIFSK